MPAPPPLSEPAMVSTRGTCEAGAANAARVGSVIVMSCECLGGVSHYSAIAAGSMCGVLNLIGEGFRLKREAQTVERDGFWLEREALTVERDSFWLEREAQTVERGSFWLEREAQTVERDSFSLTRQGRRMGRRAFRLERNVRPLELQTAALQSIRSV